MVILLPETGYNCALRIVLRQETSPREGDSGTIFVEASTKAGYWSSWQNHGAKCFSEISDIFLPYRIGGIEVFINLPNPKFFITYQTRNLLRVRIIIHTSSPCITTIYRKCNLIRRRDSGLRRWIVFLIKLFFLYAGFSEASFYLILKLATGSRGIGDVGVTTLSALTHIPCPFHCEYWYIFPSVTILPSSVAVPVFCIAGHTAQAALSSATSTSTHMQ